MEKFPPVHQDLWKIIKIAKKLPKISWSYDMTHIDDVIIMTSSALKLMLIISQVNKNIKLVYVCFSKKICSFGDILRARS